MSFGNMRSPRKGLYGEFVSNSTKILFDTIEEQVAKINRLRAADIVSIEPCLADETTTKKCCGVLAWYYK